MTKSEKLLSLLSTVDVFAGLEDHELEHLQRTAQEVSLPSDTIVFRQGDKGDKMYLVVQGIIEIWKSEGHDMKGSRLARLKQGEIFGEMALFDKEPRSATAIASIAREIKIWVWDEKDLIKLIHEHPSMGTKLLLNLLKKVSNRLRVANDAIHTLLRSNQYIGL
ncbi:MAG: hypothetical protein A2901_04545 [Elusimicrobia bacterium RIFCSPLOWO2_01_FULL_54_10]|nr:MAG: hypothetical protein A2901_04545 [Elusimicrobia bacterium RIFCSPLOWO2_01_FULL_54_10]